MRRTFTRAAGITLITAALIAPAIAIATAATATTPLDCTYITVDTDEAFTTDGAAAPNGGTATLIGDGVVLSTPKQASHVNWRHTLAKPVAMDKVTALSYLTDRQDAATGVPTTVASYKLGIDSDSDGDEDGRLTYEPYYNREVTGAAATNDTFADGSGKWWYTKEPGNLQTLATYAKWAAGTGPVAFTKPQILWFGVGQGTYNDGAITLVNQVKFKAAGACVSARFGAPKGMPSPDDPSPSVSPSRTTSASPSVSVSPSKPSSAPPSVSTSLTTDPTVSPTTITPPPIDDHDEGDAAGGTAGGGSTGGTGDGLPLTGPAMAGLGLVAAVAISGGVFLLVLTRRRRATGTTHFTA
jgi:hypothetical protein